MTDDQAPSAETEDPPTTEPSEIAQPEENTTPDTSDTDGANPAPDDGLSRRDHRYREKLRAAEAERDTLRQNLETMQRREVERVAADHLTKPAALWTAGVELSTLIGEDGTVDPERVLAATQDAKQQLGLEDPQAKRRRGPVVPREGTTVGSGGKSSTWNEAFKR